MKAYLRKVGIYTSSIIIFFISMIGILAIGGGRINTSASIPIGLYWITKAPMKIGDYVLFCPPQKPIFQEALRRGYISSGFCPGRFGYLMKRVFAKYGDIVSINSQGVTVNNHYVAHSRPYSQDAQGLPLPLNHLHQYQLKYSELLLMTDQSDLSFDARYFGFIDKSQIKAVLIPVITMQSTQINISRSPL